jgi:hypothetical protein
MNRLKWLARGVLAAAICCIPSLAAAHGGGTPQITDLPAGPYRLFVWTSPDPWRAESADDQGQTFPVTGAAVRVGLAAADGSVQRVELAATPVSAVATGFYEADHPLPAAGPWEVSVQVEGEAGKGAVSFAVHAEPAAAVNWPLWIGAAVALLALAGILGTRRPPFAAKVAGVRPAPH